MPATTKPQIQVLINAIQPEVEFPAESMNVLLTQMLNASFGPLWKSAIDGAAPVATDDETLGYRAGSVGYNSSTDRVYLCVSATAGAASWVLASLDKGVVTQSLGMGDTFQATTSTSTIILGTVGIGATVKLPANPYLGKVVSFITQNVTVNLYIKNAAGTAVATLATTSANSSFSFVCTNAVNSTWTYSSYAV